MKMFVVVLLLFATSCTMDYSVYMSELTPDDEFKFIPVDDSWYVRVRRGKDWKVLYWDFDMQASYSTLDKAMKDIEESIDKNQMRIKFNQQEQKYWQPSK